MVTKMGDGVVDSLDLNLVRENADNNCEDLEGDNEKSCNDHLNDVRGDWGIQGLAAGDYIGVNDKGEAEVVMSLSENVPEGAFVLGPENESTDEGAPTVEFTQISPRISAGRLTLYGYHGGSLESIGTIEIMGNPPTGKPHMVAVSTGSSSSSGQFMIDRVGNGPGQTSVYYRDV